uniref:COesterase domain-containing protein n=1 Tax=Elaeophora elaphi TaxID=1147741 RepID=A0A0R3RZR2_9BILA
MFSVICQIDLGSFSLGQNKYGDLKFIFNQAANILGFGGDRGFDLTLGEGYRLLIAERALISGERVGVDSDVGINEFEGFGSSPISFNNPAGQFVSFLEGIKKFFTTTITNKPPDTMWSSPQYENPSVKTGTVFHAFEEPEKQKISGETMNYGQPENDDYDNYYHNVGVSF